MQPLSDGIKLFSKEVLIPNHVNVFLFIFSPILSFILSIFVWNYLYFNSQEYFNEDILSLLIILAINSLGIYSIILAGWSSNSKYAFLGSIRATSQMKSYEISLGFLLGNIILLSESFNLSKIYLQQIIFTSFSLPFLPICIIFFISLVVEINRAPFDLTEGESELVSGFNIEYSSFIFALFFLAEYAHIYFSCIFFSIIFLTNIFINNFIISIFLVIIILLIRTSYPRFRYDKIMYLLWKTYLPLSIFFLILNIILFKLC